MKHYISFIVITLSVLFLNSDLFAIDYIMSKSGNWSTSSYWTPNGVPSSSDNVTIPSGITTWVNNDYSCNNIIINDGGTLRSNAGTTLYINGNFTNNGTFICGTATVSFSGISTQKINGLATTFYNLIINNSAGITLNTNINVNNSLTMSSGNIDATGYLLSLGTGTGNIGTFYYNSGTIITDSTGGFKRWFAKSTMSNVYFPVGSGSTINMITLSFTSAPSSAGSLTAKFVPVDPRNYSSITLSDAGYSIDAYSQRGYWQITTGDGLTGGTYNLNLRAQGFNPNGNEIGNYQHLRILKRPASGNGWALVGNHQDAAQYSNYDPIVKRTGLSGFSQFAIGGSSTDGNPLQGPLPIELASFSASIIDRDVKLSWITANEHNNSGFEIYRASKDENNNWIKIGFVAGNGTKNTPTNYSFEDKKLSTGKFSYRLKQIDYNGNYEYFNLSSDVVVGTPKKSDLSQNYPNPFNPTTSIDYQITEDSKVTLKVYDISGREVRTLVNMNQKSGFYTVQFNASNLSSGNYFYKLITSSNGSETVITKKMTVIK